MIVRDEQAYLPACLDSLEGVVDELVIVDTGSIDNTAEIALDYGAKLKVKSERGGHTALKLAEMSNAKDSYEVIKIALDAQKNKKRKKKGLIV